MRIRQIAFAFALVATVSGFVSAQEPAASGPAPTETEDDQLSEIVVTGTYIRRSDFQQASPVDVISAETLKKSASSDMARALVDLPYNTGALFNYSAGNAAQGGNREGGSNVNLRGLGASATLVLLNGRRHTPYPASQTTYVDINEMIPDIMISRIDVLKDGASALYGTDAVGGVVNFVTRDRFSGLEASLKQEWITQVSKGRSQFEAIWGGGSERTHIVAAMQLDRADLVRLVEWDAAANFVNGSSQGAPGNYSVPNRNAAGLLTGTSVSRPDPDCARIAQSYLVGSTCWYDFEPDVNGQSGLDQKQFYARVSHEISDRLEFKGEMGFSETKLETTNTASANLTSAVIIPGENPGNSFRAVNAAGAPLFAIPDPSNPARPLRDATGNVVLSPNPTDPSSGIAFNEDLRWNARPIGSQGGLPTGNSLAAGEFAASRLASTENRSYRIGGEIAGAFSDWDWNAGVAYSRYEQETGALGSSQINVPALNRALQGLGGPYCGAATTPGVGNCEYFNPFGNAVFATPGATGANTQDIIDYIMPGLVDSSRSSLMETYGVLSGPIVSLPAGALSGALGLQFRKSTLLFNYDALRNTASTEQGVPSVDFDAARDTRAAFAEVVVPLVKSDSFGYLEFNGAVRHEDAGGELVSTDPKLGLIYTSPGRQLTLRGSIGTSFLAPSLFQQYSTSTSTASLPLDPVTGQTNIRPTAILAGNSSLEPETADTLSAGIEFMPRPELRFGVTYWAFDFENRIAPEVFNDILLSDPTGPRVIRDPVTGSVLRIDATYFNASRMETSGLDIEAGYQLDLSGAGRFNFDLSATHVLQYDLQATPGSPVMDRTSNYNVNTTFGSPSIDWRATAKTTWSRGNHSAYAAIKYTDGFLNDRPNPAGFDPNVPSYTTTDVSYTYSFEKLGSSLKDLQLSVGANNVFDKDAPIGAFTVFFFSSHDYRGRVAWARVSTSF